MNKKDKKFQDMVAQAVSNAKKARASKQKTEEWRKQYSSMLRENCSPIAKGNSSSSICAKTSVFDTEWNKKYDEDPVMAEREKEALAVAEQKKKYLVPQYNKGPVQYSPNQDDLKNNGRRPPSY